MCVAFDSNALTEFPLWTRLDDPTGPFTLTSWQIDRGRIYETEKTSTGTASFTLVDRAGDFDPTRTSGPFYGKLDPYKQACIVLQNPVTGVWSTIFRGFVSEWLVEPHPTERFNFVTCSLVDGMDFLAAAELVPGSFGDTPPASALDGDVYYGSDTSLAAIRARIVRTLDDVDWPGAGVGVGTLRSIFSGNVGLQAQSYSPRSTALEVILDCADAEFPNVANFYISKDGKATFHGRYARFHPSVVEYGINTWQIGDTAAVAASPSTVAPVSPPISFHRDKEQLFTAAIATPKDIAEADIEAQYGTAASSSTLGFRTWSAENLLTQNGEGPTTAIQETAKFRTYVLQNFASAATRVGQLTFRPQPPSGTSGSTLWALMCGVDISDIVHLKTTHAGGGGFDTDFYVEGVHYDCVPMNDDHPDVTMTLDVSPRSYYNSNPFAQ